MNSSEQIVCCVLILISLAVGNLYGRSGAKPRFNGIDVLAIIAFLGLAVASTYVLVFEVGRMVMDNWGSK